MHKNEPIVILLIALYCTKVLWHIKANKNKIKRTELKIKYVFYFSTVLLNLTQIQIRWTLYTELTV